MSDRNYLPWWRLDNAAKIFPSTSSAHDSKVFRFFCELEEEIEPAALQAALDKTMERFPIYRCVLRRGWFWYYLEESPLPAPACPEQLPPCFPVYPSPRRSLLFVALFLPLLVLMAWRGKWFPMEQAGAWVTFFGIFFLIFIGMTIGFDFYFRITGRKYDGMIGQYRKQKEEKGE